MPRIVRAEDLRTRKAQQTGIYVGPERPKPLGPDTRFFKAGSDVPPDYRFVRERGAAPRPAPKT